MSEKQTIRTVFGKEIDVSKVAGINARELMDYQQGLLSVTSGDPNYVYVWLVANSPETSAFVRKGQYEVVDPSTDPVVCNAAIVEDKTYRIKELVLARIPKEFYEAKKAAARAIQLRREIATSDLYRQTMQQIAGDFDVEPTFEKTERQR